jgi:hypothetical protein
MEAAQNSTGSAPLGYRWMVSPDGSQASLVHETEVRFYPAWADCTDMSNEEVADVMKQRRQEAQNNAQLQLAA